MKRWLRHHRYALRVALRRLIQQPFSSLANMLVIALSLTLPLMGAIVLSSAQPVFGPLAIDPQITLFLAHDAGAAQLDHIARRLQAEHGEDVAELRIVPRTQALEQLKDSPGWSEALAALPEHENPLPDAIVVSLRQDASFTDAAARADALAQQWRQWQAVDHVQLDGDWMRRLQAILDTLRLALGLLALGVGMVVLATTFNTVRMQALSQRAEIEIARLVGATESFVRRPFLYLGALSGVAASLLAIAVTSAILPTLNRALQALAASYGVDVTLRLPSASNLLAALVIVAALCALSARWSVMRTTRI